MSSFEALTFNVVHKTTLVIFIYVLLPLLWWEIATDFTNEQTLHL
jgi:hypothetical protein